MCNTIERHDITGDTIINGSIYHKIESFRIVNCSFGCPQYSEWEIEFIKEDSAKRIWMLDTISMNDTLLYDFNLSVGDTINTLFSNDLYSPHIIQSIDSILVGAGYRKIYYYSNYGNVGDFCTLFLIEGIGAGGGLFSPLCGNGCYQANFKLSCFKQDGNVLYYPNLISCTGDSSICNFNVAVNDIKSEKYFSLFPNPATSEITVASAGFNVERIEMWNVVGESLTPALSKGEGVRIDVSSLPAGIYFVAVTDAAGNRAVRKVVKM
jgi:hypothetical protein